MAVELPQSPKVSLAQTGSPMNRNRDRLKESTEEGAEAVNVAQSQSRDHAT